VKHQYFAFNFREVPIGRFIQGHLFSACQAPIRRSKIRKISGNLASDIHHGSGDNIDVEFLVGSTMSIDHFSVDLADSE
jgi:hypothetical protein